MASPDLELQGAIYGRLMSFVPLAELVGEGIYDNPSADVNYPYVTIGEAYCLRADAECVDGQEIRLTLHAWSTRSDGFEEVKLIAGAVVDALHRHSLPLTTHRLISISHRTTRVMRDADGITSHAIIEFVAFTERL